VGVQAGDGGVEVVDDDADVVRMVIVVLLSQAVQCRPRRRPLLVATSGPQPDHCRRRAARTASGQGTAISAAQSRVTDHDTGTQSPDRLEDVNEMATSIFIEPWTDDETVATEEG
jgi:hypothetical protein